MRPSMKTPEQSETDTPPLMGAQENVAKALAMFRYWHHCHEGTGALINPHTELLSTFKAAFQLWLLIVFMFCFRQGCKDKLQPLSICSYREANFIKIGLGSWLILISSFKGGGQ